MYGIKAAQSKQCCISAEPTHIPTHTLLCDQTHQTLQRYLVLTHSSIPEKSEEKDPAAPKL